MHFVQRSTFKSTNKLINTQYLRHDGKGDENRAFSPSSMSFSCQSDSMGEDLCKPVGRSDVFRRAGMLPRSHRTKSRVAEQPRALPSLSSSFISCDVALCLVSPVVSLERVDACARIRKRKRLRDISPVRESDRCEHAWAWLIIPKVRHSAALNSTSLRFVACSPHTRLAPSISRHNLACFLLRFDPAHPHPS